MSVMVPTSVEIEQWHDFLSLLGGVVAFLILVCVVCDFWARRIVSKIEQRRQS